MNTKISTQDLLKRKSVRRYTEDWSQGRTEEVLQMAAGMEPLFENISWRFFSIESDNVLGQGKADAPCYLVLYSSAEEGWQENAGFLLHQLELILSKNGIGSVMLSGSKPIETPKGAEGMEMALIISLGMPGEELYSQPLQPKKRKAIEEICSNEAEKALVEYARIASSSGNGQPWYFGGEAKRIDIYTEMAGDAFNTRNTGLKLMDTGIACYALYVAAKEEGRYLGFETIADHAPEPKGYIYNRSLRLS